MSVTSHSNVLSAGEDVIWSEPPEGMSLAYATLVMWASLVQNIAEWEMTDDDIEVAIKLADKSGDGRIDYDEFIAFVFGDDEPVQRLQQTGTNSIVPEPESSQLQAAPPQAAAAAAAKADMLLLYPAATDAAERLAEAQTLGSNSWPGVEEPPAAYQPPEADPSLCPADPVQAAVLSARQQSLTDAWVAAQAAEATQASTEPAQTSTQAGIVYDNALYQDDAPPCAPQAAAARQVPPWEVSSQAASSDSQAQAGQPGDDVRLDIQADDAMSDDMQLPSQHQLQAPWAQQAGQGTTSYLEDDLNAEGQAGICHDWLQTGQQCPETPQLPGVNTVPDPSDEAQGATALLRSEGRQGSEPEELQATQHGDAIHLALPSEGPEHATGFARPSGTTSLALLSSAEQPGSRHHTTKPTKGLLTKAPKRLPALSYVQLSKGVNRSQVNQQQSHKKS